MLSYLICSKVKKRVQEGEKTFLRRAAAALSQYPSDEAKEFVICQKYFLLCLTLD